MQMASIAQRPYFKLDTTAPFFFCLAKWEFFEHSKYCWVFATIVQK